MIKMIKSLFCLCMMVGLVACTATPQQETPTLDTFSAHYEMKGTTSNGKPKNDTFLFEGTTQDGIITELNFDVIRNKGMEGEYSKKDIMGYLMNISDATVEKSGDGTQLVKLTSYGYDTAYAAGTGAQFMVSASAMECTDTTTIADLVFINDATSTPEKAVTVELDKALIAFGYVAKEAGIEVLTKETLVKDIVVAHGLYTEGKFIEGTKRISYAGFAGGRSYGEQLDAIAAHIIDNKMTLEEVYEMFKTENQPGTEIQDRDAITGATITFVGDFQRMAYMAIHGVIFEGVVTHTSENSNTVVEVVTQGYAGEIETHVTFDQEGKIVHVAVRDAQETPEYGGKLTPEGSEYIASLIAGQENVDGIDIITGATVTSTALKNAISFAIEYFKGI